MIAALNIFYPAMAAVGVCVRACAKEGERRRKKEGGEGGRCMGCKRKGGRGKEPCWTGAASVTQVGKRLNGQQSSVSMPDNPNPKPETRNSSKA